MPILDIILNTPLLRNFIIIFVIVLVIAISMYKQKKIKFSDVYFSKYLFWSVIVSIILTALAYFYL